MKTMRLSIPRVEASKILKDSLRTISPAAFRMFAATDCYGNVNIGDNETTFTIGLGPTGFATVCGRIVEISPKISEIFYNFEGPFFLFLTKFVLVAHILRIFEPYQEN